MVGHKLAAGDRVLITEDVITAGTAAVSYTHLDVYKRQIHILLLIAAADIRIEFLNGRT